MVFSNTNHSFKRFIVRGHAVGPDHERAQRTGCIWRYARERAAHATAKACWQMACILNHTNIVRDWYGMWTREEITTLLDWACAVLLETQGFLSLFLSICYC